MNHRLHDLAEQSGVDLAASLIAVDVASRIAFAREWAATGRWVHADVIEGAFRGQPGISIEHLHELAAVEGIRLDIHLMVDDPIQFASNLPHVSRITTEIPAGISAVAAVARLRELADEVWISAENPDARAELLDCGLDGFLLMLTPPGQAGHSADLARLGTAPPAEPGRGLGVDGGVNAANLALIAAAGVGYAVVGRALHESHS